MESNHNMLKRPWILRVLSFVFHVLKGNIYSKQLRRAFSIKNYPKLQKAPREISTDFTAFYQRFDTFWLKFTRGY